MVVVRSGGQTGVDRAALDAARQLGAPIAGWCPRGRLAEDGVIPADYPLRETPSSDYAQRTEWNVRDSDATLILHRGKISGGTELTLRLAESLGRFRLCVDLSVPPPPEEIAAWLIGTGVKELNVAGPRESQQPGIYAQALAFLEAAFKVSPGRD